MPKTKEIDVMESVYDKNEMIAKETNERLTKKDIFAVNVMGSPGAGKTSSIKRIAEKIGEVIPYVIEGDIESDIDTRALNSLGIKTIQINTGGACHLDSPLIENAVNDLDVSDGVLFIENIGNLVCPAEFEIGEHVKMLISTTTEGSDKPYKYPLAFEKADIILINKCDLIPYVDFDEEYFMKGVRALNPTAPVMKVSAKNGEGYEEVVSWIKNKRE
ncbi:hydrogenase nickel incorporation protein HypB [Blautia liquoris]|uniref:Hydrogenase nickel incorporation protein HypB n=1 Tax=Blautia liquoris TaxID=2779518 RepID=A0A7M2RK38_9FIRM|nr:hydrogenase nickel incorporation protein HypB [Blautia liquoris]QOV20421.1 hydrogenase nickel incorporation protein HypB [Blautia liquoris]